ncbi:hypothetical protein RFI_10990 [Reticulomyxa filosa]|uniref:Uncharacterized protein n=1 Tax=Reticulomyxa filosa TaxID=46433 RepID=X6NIJ1_RETFI|nr:hypothetical protein RFI_10990 [Reticulomyxa filosa]|eukprot:ETO26145.1 hypothetical protein RFI_10990 [Reticulomyxa filosa]
MLISFYLTCDSTKKYLTVFFSIKIQFLFKVALSNTTILQTPYFRESSRHTKRVTVAIAIHITKENKVHIDSIFQNFELKILVTKKLISIFLKNCSQRKKLKTKSKFNRSKVKRFDEFIEDILSIYQESQLDYAISKKVICSKIGCKVNRKTNDHIAIKPVKSKKLGVNQVIEDKKPLKNQKTRKERSGLCYECNCIIETLAVKVYELDRRIFEIKKNVNKKSLPKQFVINERKNKFASFKRICIALQAWPLYDVDKNVILYFFNTKYKKSQTKELYHKNMFFTDKKDKIDLRRAKLVGNKNK